MDTTIEAIEDDVYRISTFVPDVGLSFNQILVVADEPLLFHLGKRACSRRSLRPLHACSRSTSSAG